MIKYTIITVCFDKTGGKRMRLNFLTTGWSTSHSGIEQAIKQRIQLFEKHNLPYRLVTVEPDVNQHELLKDDGINDKKTVNLYDYFAGDVNTPRKQYTFETLKKVIPKNIQLKVENEVSMVGNLDDHTIFRAYAFQNHNIEQIDIYDKNYRNRQVIWFDSRGWPACISDYDLQGNVIMERRINSEGKLYHQVQFQKNDVTGESEKTIHQLFWKDQIFTFDGDNSLYSFFYDCLVYDSTQKEVFLVDRTNELDYPVLNMKLPIAKYMYLHSDHINSHNKDPKNNIDDELHGSLNPNYEYALNHIEKWDGVLMPTAWQKEIFQRRYKNLAKTYIIPVGYIPENTVKQVPWESRDQYKIICMARLAEEKSLDDLIHAYQIVALSYPESTLEFWGFDAGEKEFLENEVKQCNLEKNIKFMGYTRNPGKVYDKAQIAVLPSHNEGFALSLMESIGHGVPTITYEAYYGSRAIIDDGKDGYLAEPGNINDISIKLLDLIQNPAKAKKFSENAYKLSKKYSEKTILSRWKRFLEIAEKACEKKTEKVNKHHVSEKRIG